MESFKYQSRRLVYETRGSGRRPFILLPGLLMNRKMHYPLAERLADAGNWVIMFDPLGHGDSDRPENMWNYSMPILAEQVIALMDHLEIKEAVIGGPSMGANISLEAAVLAPERMRGIVIEMPVLDNAIPAIAVIFTPVLLALTLGKPVVSVVSSVVNRVPRGLHYFLDIVLDTVRQDPGPSGAVLQGMFFGRTAPPRHLLKEIEVPALVLGHTRDMVHPFSDAQMLATLLPNGKLIEANSVLELRSNPDRLTKKVEQFLDLCWAPKAARKKPSRAASK